MPLEIPAEEESRAVCSGRPSLAVVYFENKTGDKSLDEWSTGLQDLLITDLSQSKFLRVLSGDKIYSILKKLDLHETRRYSTDDLVKVANEGAAEYTISGSFIKAGSQLLVNATLQKPRTEDVIRNIRVECQTFDEITAKVDDLTKQLKAASEPDRAADRFRSRQESRQNHLAECGGLAVLRRGEEIPLERGIPTRPFHFSKRRSLSIPNSSWPTKL